MAVSPDNDLEFACADNGLADDTAGFSMLVTEGMFAGAGAELTIAVGDVTESSSAAGVATSVDV